MAPSTEIIIDNAALDELKARFKGTIHRRADSGFVRHSQLFNAAIHSQAQLLVRPLHAQDVSAIVKFCAKHGLSPSVKSGGYGTHGWAVEGDVIVDMRLIAQITIERPVAEPDKPEWSSLRDSPHVEVVDPDTLKGKARVPSATAFPTAYPSTVGPPPIHAPFTDPKRRSADEAFSSAIDVQIVASPAPEDNMQVDGEALSVSTSGDGSGSNSSLDRPARRQRMASPLSAHNSHTSSTSTPPATHSPHTPNDDGIKPLNDKDQSVSYMNTTAANHEPPNQKAHGPATVTEVEHDEGMLPPSADRPAVGVDMRGFVGREVGGWDTVWNRPSSGGVPAESVGATHMMGAAGGNSMMGMGGMGINMGMGAGMGMGASSWLWAPPAAATPPPLAPMNMANPRSNAPPSARPFDFSDSAPTAAVNAFANPHAAPPAPATNSVFPGTGNSLFTNGSRPFNFTSSTSSTPIATTAPDPGSPPRASSSATPVPRVTHVPFVPAPSVSHTYVTFGAGASQKDIDAFCAAHPLAAVVAGGAGVEGEEDEQPRIVADSARPEMYERPTETGFGAGSGSFFAPGMGRGPGGTGYGQSSPTSSVSSAQIPYFVPFAAHPVGSSVMLLGGFGFLSRLHGLSMDCLVEAEVVLPDGRIVWVSEEGVRGEDGEVLEEVDGGEGWDESEGDTLEEKEEGDKAGVQERETGEDEGEGTKGKEKEKEKEKEDTLAPKEKDGEDKPRPKRGLWWALRGAGSAFGIVVRYKAKAFPVPVVFAGNLVYNFNKLSAASLIKHFRDCIKSAPRELYANCILTAGPKGKGALVVIQICYAGPRAEGLPFLQAISSWEGEGCLLNEVQEKEFVWQQDSVAKVLKGGSGRKWFIRSDLISSLTDEIIHSTVRKFGDTPDGCTWLFELSGGALVDRTDTCLPKVAREAAFTIVALHQWKLEQNDPACVMTAEEWIKQTLGPQTTGGPFPCFLERREKRSRILGVYGRENWARLCALKRHYDPAGMFRHNFWPLDEAGQPIVDPKLMRLGEGGEKTSGHMMDDTLDGRGVPIAV